MNIQLKKIISGGQNGADQGGLDAAIQMGFSHSGYCPQGRLCENGIIPSCYRLIQTKSATYPPRTKANIRISDFTLIFVTNPSRLGRGSRLTVKQCKLQGKPYAILSWQSPNLPQLIAAQLKQHNPSVLNVAGTRQSKAPGIQQAVATSLAQALQSLNNPTPNIPSHA